MMVNRGQINLSLTYNVKELLEKVKKNREKHIEKYEKAMAVYKDQMIIALGKKMDKAKKGELVSHRIDLKKPETYADYYNTAIAMLEATVDEEITIDNFLFNQLARDQWEWSESFDQTTIGYLK